MTNQEQRTYDKIQTLVRAGILGPELVPEPNYWHWAILKPEELPDEFQDFKSLGEVRW